MSIKIKGLCWGWKMTTMICYSSERGSLIFFPWFWAGLCDLLDQQNTVGASLWNFQGWVIGSFESFAWVSWNTCSKSPDLPLEMCGCHFRNRVGMPETHRERQRVSRAHSARKSCQGTKRVNEAEPHEGTSFSAMVFWILPWYSEYLPWELNMGPAEPFLTTVLCDIIKSCCLKSMF